MEKITINELFTKLNNCYFEDMKSFKLEKNLLNEISVKNILETWVGNELKFTDMPSPPQKIENTIVLNGSFDFLNIKGKNVTAIFGLISTDGVYSDQGTISLLIKFQISENGNEKCNLVNSFPKLHDSLLSEIHFNNSYYILSSFDRAENNEFPSLLKGLNFQSKVFTNQQPLDSIIGLIEKKDKIDVLGTVSIVSGNIHNLNQLVPKVILDSPSFEIEIGGYLKLPINLRFLTELRNYKNGEYLYAGMQLCSKVKIGNGKIPEIPVISDILKNSKTIVFTANLENSSNFVLSNLSELISLFNGINIDNELNFNLGDYIALKTIRIIISTSELAKGNLKNVLEAVYIDISTPKEKEFEIIKEYIKLKNLNISFMVNNPTNNPIIFCIVDGKFELLKNIDLIASASFPNPKFSLALEQGKKVHFNKLFEEYKLPLPKTFPNLYCEKFSMFADQGAGKFSIESDIASNWKIRAGICDIAITNAGFTLNYDKKFSGNLRGTAEFSQPPALMDLGKEPIVFDVDWNIPGAFTLKGEFPEINITDLSKQLLGTFDVPYPEGFPQISFTNTTAILTIGGENSGSTMDCDFSLESTVNIFNKDIGAVFQITKKGNDFGFITGLWTGDWDFSPAKQWPEYFGEILKGINFSNTGIIISSLNETNLSLDKLPANLPREIKKGITLFTTINITKASLLGVFNDYLPDNIKCSLYALIGYPIDQSKMIVSIEGPSTSKAVSFDELGIILNAADKSIGLKANVSLTFNEIAGENKGKPVKVTFIGGGKVDYEGQLTFSFGIKAEQETLSFQEINNNILSLLDYNENSFEISDKKSLGWKDPFGITGLTIENFMGTITAGAKTFDLGFIGAIRIGKGDKEIYLAGGGIGGLVAYTTPYIKFLKFVIKKEESKTNELSITELLEYYTSIELNSVPVLNQLILQEFQIILVIDTKDFVNETTNASYAPGFFMCGKIIFYGFKIMFDIEVNFKKGIKASGSIDKPIVLGGGAFIFSAADNPNEPKVIEGEKKGPRALIDTSALTQPGKKMIEVSGRLEILGSYISVFAEVENNSFIIDTKLDVGFLKGKLTGKLTESREFTGSVGGQVKFNVDIPYIKLPNGTIVIPAFKLDIDLIFTINLEIKKDLKFNVKGSFKWESLTLTVNFDLPGIKNFSEITDKIRDFFINNVNKVFYDVIKTAEAWVNAIKEKLFTVGDEAAKMLSKGFNVVAKEAVKFMKDIGIPVDKIQIALERLWGETPPEAQRLIREAMGACAVTNAAQLLLKPNEFNVQPFPEFIYDIGKTEKGQDLLVPFYANMDTISDIAMNDPDINARLQRMHYDYSQTEIVNEYIVEDLIVLINEISTSQSNSFSASVNNDFQDDMELIMQKLRPLRRLSYPEFINSF
jgi:hypothetical protein